MKGKMLSARAVMVIWMTAMTCRTAGHEVNVHELLTLRAAALSQNLAAFHQDIFGNSDIWTPKLQRGAASKSPQDWMMYGSEREDNEGRPLNLKMAPVRTLHHFYTPRRPIPQALSDTTEFPFQITFITPVNSFERATADPNNDYSWRKARAAELQGWA